MNVKINFNESKVLHSFDKSYSKSRKWLKNEVAKDTNVFTPMLHGTLRESVIPSIGTDDDFLIWSIVYAAYQYYGSWADGTHVIQRHSQPGTDILYFEKAKAIHKEKWIRVARKLAGGRL